jgi:adhesin/invasin
MRLPRATAFVVSALAAALAQGCAKKETVTGTTTANAAAGLVIVQGNNQTVQAGKELPTPVVLRVVNLSGSGLAGAQVNLSIAEGGGIIEPASAVSDAKGEIKAKWTLGPSTPVQSLLGTTAGVEAVKMYATALLPSEVIIAQGNNQSARVGNSLANSIVIRVVGAGNVPLAGIPVALQILSGGGAISPQTALTSALGEVTVKWTMGFTPGINQAAVSVSTLTNVVIQATATP